MNSDEAKGMKKLLDAAALLLRDERAQALTEYVILMFVISTVCFWLYHPDNGIFQAFRARYDMTALMLSLPGP
ncbi:MAG: hypothetical protein WCP86_10610 [bacterium]